MLVDEYGVVFNEAYIMSMLFRAANMCDEEGNYSESIVVGGKTLKLFIDGEDILFLDDEDNIVTEFQEYPLSHKLRFVFTAMSLMKYENASNLGLMEIMAKTYLTLKEEETVTVVYSSCGVSLSLIFSKTHLGYLCVKVASHVLISSDNKVINKVVVKNTINNVMLAMETFNNLVYPAYLPLQVESHDRWELKKTLPALLDNINEVLEVMFKAMSEKETDVVGISVYDKLNNEYQLVVVKIGITDEGEPDSIDIVIEHDTCQEAVDWVDKLLNHVRKAFSIEVK